MEEILPGLSHAPNIHPIFVHFPIAFWLGAALLCALGSARKHEALFAAGRWLLYLGTLGAAAAVATGFWATETMGHDASGHDLVHVHRNFMLVSSSIALVTTIVAFVLRRRSGAGVRWAITALLLATAIVTTLGADRGAELVFRYGIGTADEPPPASDHDHDTGEAHDHGSGADEVQPHHGTEASREGTERPESTAQQPAAAPQNGDGGARDAAAPTTNDESPEHDHDHAH